ncbi:hypothetical protein D3C73_1379250 [compost metagenome]
MEVERRVSHSSALRLSDVENEGGDAVLADALQPGRLAGGPGRQAMGHAIGHGDAGLALGRALRARRGDELDLQGVRRGHDDGVAMAAEVGEG